jgi:hypothetical protein
MKRDRGNVVTLAHLVSTPFHARGVGAIIIVAPRLGLLLGLSRLLVPAGLSHQARRCAHPGPDGRSLPRITTDGTPDSANGGATGCSAHCTALLGRRAAALGCGCVGSTPVCPLAH